MWATQPGGAASRVPEFVVTLFDRTQKNSTTKAWETGDGRGGTDDRLRPPSSVLGLFHRSSAPISPPTQVDCDKTVIRSNYCFLHKYGNFERSKYGYLRQQFGFTFLRSTL